MATRLHVLALGLCLVSAGSCAWLTRDKRIRHLIEAEYAIETDEFRDSASALLGAPLTGGNRAVELLNGDRIFPAMLEAIRGAKKTITIETFIWSSGKISDQFVAAIAERAKAGVKVHILVDAVGGARLKNKDIEIMTDAGARFVTFSPPISMRFFRLNLRTHRKIMVVDGRVGFAGGVCLSDDWQGDAQPPYWRDTQFRVEGPVVAQMQAVFMENWLQAESEVLHGEAYFPRLKDSGNMTAQFVKSGYHDDAETTRMSYLLSLAAARKTVRFAQAYFAPDSLMIDALLEARRRGVKIEIIVPKKTDNIAIGKAARPRWNELLKAGIEFWEYQPTLYHCKIVIVDDVWSIVGSVNFDERSMRLSDEANLNVLDRGFAAALIRSFEADKMKSKRLTAEGVKKRGLLSRWSDHFFGLFRAQL